MLIFPITATSAARPVMVAEPKFIPVIFHNLREFDGHILCQCIGKLKDKKLKVIAQNMARYVSFSVDD